MTTNNDRRVSNMVPADIRHKAAATEPTNAGTIQGMIDAYVREHSGDELERNARNVARGTIGLTLLGIFDAERTCREASADITLPVFSRAMHAESALVYKRAVELRIADVATGSTSEYLDERARLLERRRQLQAQLDAIVEVRARLDEAVESNRSGGK